MARNDDYYGDESPSSGRYDDTGREGADAQASEPTGEDVARATGASDGRMVYAGGREGDDTWLTRGLAAMLLVTGAILFLIPEPATSLFGIGLMVVGLVAWVVTSQE